MTLFSVYQPRFKLKHIFLAVATVVVCIAAYSRIEQRQERALIKDVYGDYEAYRLLLNSQQLDIIRVLKTKEVNPAIEDWQIPKDTEIVLCGSATGEQSVDLRTLMTSPKNFVVPFLKDWVFRPTLGLRAGQGEHLTIYFCFESATAALTVDGRVVRWLMIDNVAGELQKALSEICPDHAKQAEGSTRSVPGYDYR